MALKCKKIWLCYDSTTNSQAMSSNAVNTQAETDFSVSFSLILVTLLFHVFPKNASKYIPENSSLLKMIYSFSY